MGTAEEFAPLLRVVGTRIRQAREAAGLTQEQAAEAAGMDPRCWRRLENGEINPTLSTLARVAGALGIDLLEAMALSRQA